MLSRLRTGVLGALLALVLAPAAGAWTWPASGPVLQRFQLGPDPYAGGQSRGIVVGGAEGEAVLAPREGSVTFAGSVPRYGLAVTIATDDGYSVTLVHLGSIEVRRGAVVVEGAPVGTVGPVGAAPFDSPYVHLGVRRTPDPNGYLDPLGFLPPRPADAGTPPPPAPSPAPAPASVDAPSPVVVPGPEPVAPSPPRPEPTPPVVDTQPPGADAPPIEPPADGPARAVEPSATGTDDVESSATGTDEPGLALVAPGGGRASGISIVGRSRAAGSAPTLARHRTSTAVRVDLPSWSVPAPAPSRGAARALAPPARTAPALARPVSSAVPGRPTGPSVLRWPACP